MSDTLRDVLPMHADVHSNNFKVVSIHLDKKVLAHKPQVTWPPSLRTRYRNIHDWWRLEGDIIVLLNDSPRSGLGVALFREKK